MTVKRLETVGYVDGVWRTGDWEGVGLVDYAHEVTLDYVQVGQPSFDQVDWALLRAQMDGAHPSITARDGYGFAALVNDVGGDWGPVLTDSHLAMAEVQAGLRNVLRLHAHERTLLAMTQALYREYPRHLLAEVTAPTTAEMEVVLARGESLGAEPTHRPDLVSMPFPLLSDPSHEQLISLMAGIGLTLRPVPERATDGPLAGVGVVVDASPRLFLESCRDGRPLLAEQRVDYGSQDPVRVVRAVARQLGPGLSETVEVIRRQLSTPAGAVDRLAGLVGAACPGGVDDIRTMWSRRGIGHALHERTLAWWAWLADALDGWMAIPEELFWDGPRDPVPLARILATA